MPGLRWGRLQVDVNQQLRRGAWYRVVKVDGLEAVLEVNRKLFTVPSYLLEIVATPPKLWTVVPRPEQAEEIPPDWGPRYAVCPNCRGRAPLRRRVSKMRCERCQGVFDVGWDESYLEYL